LTTPRPRNRRSRRGPGPPVRRSRGAWLSGPPCARVPKTTNRVDHHRQFRADRKLEYRPDRAILGPGRGVRPMTGTPCPSPRRTAVPGAMARCGKFVLSSPRLSGDPVVIGGVTSGSSLPADRFPFWIVFGTAPEHRARPGWRSAAAISAAVSRPRVRSQRATKTRAGYAGTPHLGQRRCESLDEPRTASSLRGWSGTACSELSFSHGFMTLGSLRFCDRGYRGCLAVSQKKSYGKTVGGAGLTGPTWPRERCTASSARTARPITTTIRSCSASARRRQRAACSGCDPWPRARPCTPARVTCRVT